MAYITNGDISITLSGGSENSSPDRSLGGEPSNYPIIGGRLFSDVSDEEASVGLEDYKCIYANNNSFDATLYEAILYTEYKEESDVTIKLGFTESDERQTITIQRYQKITGGNFKISYTDYEGENELTIDWNSSVNTWTSNLQAALRGVKNLENVVVFGNISGESLIFEINFQGKSGKRYHEIIQEVQNNLQISNPQQGDGVISIGRSIFGSPINSIAEDIEFTTSAPFGVRFSSFESRDSAYDLKEIRPGDVIPVWIKRTVPPGSRGLENDGIDIRIEGKALPPVGG